MKQINVYEFSELSSDAQDKAVNALADINVDYDWWQFTEDDAETVGLNIKEFNLDYRSISVEFTDSATYTADKIKSEHGDTCYTYKLAQSFIADRDALVEKYSDGIQTDIVAEDNEYNFDQECDELEEEFLKELGEEYLSILRKEYEYLSSREAIIETIEANEYLFTENGKRI